MVATLSATRRAAAGLAVAVLLAGAACGGGREPAAPAADAAAIDPATAGRVTGRVTLTGTAPPDAVVRVDGDRTCATLVPGARRAIPAYVVGDGGGLGNVFVHVTSGLDGRRFPVPAAPVVIDQQQCWYAPRVVGVRVGQALEVRNSDPLLHNVRAAAALNQPFNQGQPAAGMKYTHTFSIDEVMVPITCDVHAWMRAWVGVVSHPYFAVTDASGAFELPDLPPGTYTVEAWHEAAGTVSGSVTVAPRGTATLTLTLAVPAA
jgi:plastocyanin